MGLGFTGRVGARWGKQNSEEGWDFEILKILI